MPKRKQATNIDDEIENLMKMSDKIELKKEIKNLSKQDDKRDRKIIRDKIKAQASIKVVQKNPKAKDSISYNRYQKYKSAKNTQQYFNKGGRLADLMFDYQHGYVKFSC